MFSMVFAHIHCKETSWLLLIDKRLIRYVGLYSFIPAQASSALIHHCGFMPSFIGWFKIVYPVTNMYL